MVKDQDHILSELSSISKVVAGLPKNNVFEAPEGYFLQLSNHILEKINSQNTEKETLSPLLQSLRKENPYSVPKDYLEQFSVEVNKQQTKIIPIFSLKTVLKYAVAASIIGIITTFVSLFFNNDRQSTIAKSKDEAAISTDAYALFLNETASIEEGQTETSEDDTQTLLVQMDAKMVSEILTEIPESEISNYIDLIKHEDPTMMN